MLEQELLGLTPYYCFSQISRKLRNLLTQLTMYSQPYSNPFRLVSNRAVWIGVDRISGLAGYWKKVSGPNKDFQQNIRIYTTDARSDKRSTTGYFLKQNRPKSLGRLGVILFFYSSPSFPSLYSLAIFYIFPFFCWTIWPAKTIPLQLSALVLKDKTC